ncbi:hypothetical protein B0T26DRAFT_875436 [Lasiosphaeria miniovina]|uniref:Uncharacterized protein n=1 Tax=Lasiosphaeria miniovina TaxID=1954250 RepID=A0AA40DJS9_9PEZI|nr:uncharacterized protein B0T26DRAFT_875436 [Lasiosphaeria miniovina]KAK0706204.1 hypothetical protein B0T26DRAFT_875436 [Lasiosphaeria miniovina]
MPAVMPTPTSPPGPAATPSIADAEKFIEDAWLNQELQDEFLNASAAGGDMTAWFTSKGYNTSLPEVNYVWDNWSNKSLTSFSGTYNTFLNGQPGGPTVTVAAGSVTINDVALIGYTFTNGTLAWTADKNTSSGSLTFVSFVDLNLGPGTAPPTGPNIYIGPQFKGQFAPFGSYPAGGQPNIYGRVGRFPADFASEITSDPSSAIDHALPSAGSALAQWADTYSINEYDAGSQKWVSTSDTLVIGTDGSLQYSGTAITTFSFVSEFLKIEAGVGGNTFNLQAAFISTDHSTRADPYAGNQFWGLKWAAGATAPTGKPNIMGTVSGGPSNPPWYFTLLAWLTRLAGFGLVLLQIHHGLQQEQEQRRRLLQEIRERANDQNDIDPNETGPQGERAPPPSPASGRSENGDDSGGESDHSDNHSELDSADEKEKNELTNSAKNGEGKQVSGDVNKGNGESGAGEDPANEDPAVTDGPIEAGPFELRTNGGLFKGVKFGSGDMTGFDDVIPDGFE